MNIVLGIFNLLRSRGISFLGWRSIAITFFVIRPVGVEGVRYVKGNRCYVSMGIHEEERVMVSIRAVLRLWGIIKELRRDVKLGQSKGDQLSGEIVIVVWS